MFIQLAVLQLGILSWAWLAVLLAFAKCLMLHSQQHISSAAQPWELASYWLMCLTSSLCGLLFSSGPTKIQSHGKVRKIPRNRVGACKTSSKLIAFTTFGWQKQVTRLVQTQEIEIFSPPMLGKASKSYYKGCGYQRGE